MSSNAQILGKDTDEKKKEGEVASGNTIYPGMVVEETGTTSTAGADTPTVRPINNVEKLNEDFQVALVPRTPPHANDTDIPIEHEYDAGEHIEYAVVDEGARVQNALIADGGVLSSSGDANISYDDALASNDDGALKKSSTAGSIMARAREAVDNSGGSGDQGGISAKRIDLEVV